MSGDTSRFDNTLQIGNMSALRRFQGATRLDDMPTGLGGGQTQLQTRSLNEALGLQQRLAQERLLQEQLLQEQLLSSRSQHRGHQQQRQTGLLEQDDLVVRQRQQLLLARGLLQRQQDLDDLEEMVRRRINSDRPPAGVPSDDIGQRLNRLQRSGLLGDSVLQQERPAPSWEQQRSALEQQLLGQRQTDPVRESVRESSQFLDMLAARRSPRTTDHPFHDLPGISSLAASLRDSSVADTRLSSLGSRRVFAPARSDPFAGLPAASLQPQIPRGLTPSDLLRQQLISSRRMDERGAGVASDVLAFRDRLRPAQHSGGSIVAGRRLAGEAAPGGISYLGDDPRSAAAPQGELPAILARPSDKHMLSSHQVFLRHQIEAFQASADDVTTHTRGRNKPIRLKQVGIRCRHCAHLPVSHRQKGSTYFPATLMGVYQAAQNMGTTHLQCGLCHAMPHEYKDEFARLLSIKSSSSGAGRPFWADSARELGLVDTNEGIYLRSDVPEGVDITEPDRAD